MSLNLRLDSTAKGTRSGNKYSGRMNSKGPEKKRLEVFEELRGN